MILKGINAFTNDIELISFDELKEDETLKRTYFKWLNDMDVVTPIVSEELMNPNKDMSFVEESFKRFTAENCKGFFIKYVPADMIVGTIKLDKLNLSNKSVELGLMIGEKQFWNKQIGTKSSIIAVDYAFNTLNINRLWGGTDEYNTPMQKLFLKLGFQQEGRLRKIAFFRGRYSDNLLYSMLKEDYIKLKGENAYYAVER